MNPVRLNSFPPPAVGWRPLLALLTALSLLLSGCVSLRSVPLPAPGQPTAAVAGTTLGVLVVVVILVAASGGFAITIP